MDNVNNLNGIPNFGHGFVDEAEEIGAPMTEAESTTPAEEPEEEVEISNPEETE